MAPPDALARAHAPSPAAAFVRHTLSLALDDAAATAAIAAAFFCGREAIVHDMFAPLPEGLAVRGAPVAKLRWYLARHIEVDANDEAPKAKRLEQALRTTSEIAAAATAPPSSRCTRAAACGTASSRR